MEPLKDKNVTFGASVKIYFAEDCSHEIWCLFVDQPATVWAC